MQSKVNVPLLYTSAVCVIFAIDICLSFNTGIHYYGQIIRIRSLVAYHYITHMFPVLFIQGEGAIVESDIVGSSHLDSLEVISISLTVREFNIVIIKYLLPSLPAPRSGAW